MAAAWLKGVQRWFCLDYNDTINKLFHIGFTNSASIRPVQDHAALCLNRDACWLKCVHDDLDGSGFCSAFDVTSREQGRCRAVALQVLRKSRPTFMMSGLCPNCFYLCWHIWRVSINCHIHKCLKITYFQISSSCVAAPMGYSTWINLENPSCNATTLKDQNQNQNPFIVIAQCTTTF